MAMKPAPAKLPAPAPGASSKPETTVEATIPAEVPPPVLGPVPDSGTPPEEKSPENTPVQAPPVNPLAPPVPLRAYRVRNRFEGFRPDVLLEGDTVEATEEEAASYLGKDGVLEVIPE